MRLTGHSARARSLAVLFAALLVPALFPPGPIAGQAGASSLAMSIANYSYNPATVNIATGTTIVWSNQDNDTHNVAIDRGPELFVSPVMRKGESTRFFFARVGSYHIFCEWHPQMQAVILVVAGAGSVPQPPALGSRFFPETGKSVRGAFLDYWQRNDGLAQQGFPLTEEVVEKSDADGNFYTVQYFERAVFELHPAQAGQDAVLLSLLGSFEYRRKYPRGAPGQQPNTSPGSLLFRETGRRLGGRFLEYWQRNGGLARQGFPISDEFVEQSTLNGKTYRVQYFERAVFEYHPENRPPYDVLLSQLGRQRLERAGQTASGGDGIYTAGISSAPQHYPLLAGPHASPGVNAWIYDQNPAPVIASMEELGVKWVLHQLSWYQIEPQKGMYRWDKIDRAVDEMSRGGFQVILHPVHAPQWAWPTGKVGYPTDPADFARFMSVVAKRYKGKVAGYQIWNEPNFARETGPHASASHYAAILKGGYLSIKEADRGAIVVLGALTPTGLNDPFTAVDDVIFLRRLYAYNHGELKGYFDVLGAHPGSNANPPGAMWPEKPGPGPGWTDHGSFYFRRIEELRQVMVENGDARKQVWVTEFGWMSMANPPPGFEYAAQNSEEEQARYIAEALRMGRDQYPWMGPMLVFNLNFALPDVATGPDDERIGWSLLRPDGSRRPAFAAIRDFIASGSR